MLRVEKSSIHGQGVFSERTLAIGTFLGYYTGPRLRERDLPEYVDGSPTYYWGLSSGRYIAGDSELRFINHSCAPNVEGNEVRVKGRILVAFQVLRRIPRGRELLLDYNLEKGPTDTDRYQCFCGTRKCRGTMLSLEGIKP